MYSPREIRHIRNAFTTIISIIAIGCEDELTNWAHIYEEQIAPSSRLLLNGDDAETIDICEAQTGLSNRLKRVLF